MSCLTITLPKQMASIVSKYLLATLQLWGNGGSTKKPTKSKGFYKKDENLRWLDYKKRGKRD